jgi:hypothetical protein
MSAVAHDDAFDETQGASLIADLVEVYAGCEQVGAPVAHDPDNHERRFGRYAVQAALADKWQSDKVPIALPFVDVRRAKGRDPVTQHRARVRIDDAGVVATLPVLS